MRREMTFLIDAVLADRFEAALAANEADPNDEVEYLIKNYVDAREAIQEAVKLAERKDRYE